MLSYAFLLDSAEMVFLCPFGDTISRELEPRDGRITLVRPGGDFSIESYRRCIKDYLESLFDVDKLIESLREDIQYPIAHTNVENIDLDSIDQFDIFRVSEDNLTAFSRGVRRSAIRLSNEVARFDNLSRKKRHDLLNEIKNSLSMDEEYNYCIPVFIQNSENETIPNTDDDWEGEAIKYYHLKENMGDVVDISEPGYVRLEW